MSHFISLSEAEGMTARYRLNREGVLENAYKNRNILPISETFDKAAFERLLSRPECTYVRIYYGMDEHFKIHAIIVAADEGGKDILPNEQLTDSEEEDIIERGNRCPELCPEPSPLNS